MSTYDAPSRHVYNFPAVNLAAAFSVNIRGPYNKRGRVISVSGEVTASIAGGTTLPVMTVTTTAPPIPASPKSPTPPAQSTVLNYTVPASVAPVGFSSDSVPASIVRDSNNNIQIVPANTDLVFAIAPATGTGAAGTATLQLVIDWF